MPEQRIALSFTEGRFFGRIYFMRVVLVIVFVVLLGLLGSVLLTKKGGGSSAPEEKINEDTVGEISPQKYIDFSKANSTFRFSGQILSEFEVEHIPQLKAFSIYDSRLPGESVREKSQIYITSFEANRFLTLSTVEITQQDETSIKGHDAVLYEIAKKPEAPDFPGQPNWRNFKHKALDLRLTKNNPSVFYSFAYNPKLSEEVLNSFLDSLAFH